MRFEPIAMAEPGQMPAKAGRRKELHASPAWTWALAVLLMAAAVFEQVRIGLDTDVSWLLTVGERVLDGERLYIDIFEPNPPASVLIYLPGILFARAFGLTPEFATALLVFVLASASVLLSGRILQAGNLLRREGIGKLVCMAVFAFVMLPGLCFAQREHIAVLTLLPFIAVMAVRLTDRPVPFAAALVAGIGAGITIAIKPPFVLAVAPLPLLLVWRSRSIRTGLQVECWAAAGVVVAYGLFVAAVYPVYFTSALPLLEAVYLPARNGFGDIWLSPAPLIFILSFALCAYLGRRDLVRSVAVPPLIAALGFAAAMGVQGKGYLNHVYPSVALTLFALGWLSVEAYGQRLQRTVAVTGLLLLAGASVFIFDLALRTNYPVVARTVEQVSPPNPSIIVAGTNLSVGHPLTRWVHGRWAGRRGSLWVTGGAVELLKQPMDEGRRAKLRRYIAEDRRIFVEDIARTRPDVVLVPGSIGMEWIASHRDVAQVLKPYRRAATIRGTHVLTRRPNT